MTDDCPCIPNAESGHCPHGDRDLWHELATTPPVPETPHNGIFALIAAAGDQTLNHLLAAAQDDPRLPGWLIAHPDTPIPEWAARAALIAAVQRLETHG